MKATNIVFDMKREFKEQICKILVHRYKELHDGLLPNWEEGEEVRVYEEDIDSTDVNYLHIEVSNTYDECCEVVKTPIDSYIVTLDSNLYFVVEDDEHCWDEIAIDDLAKLLDYLEAKFL
jgi:hypothetical protein